MNESIKNERKYALAWVYRKYCIKPFCGTGRCSTKGRDRAVEA
jgi:hypothetical protein